MNEQEVVLAIRQWAIDKVEEYNGKGTERIYDQFAIMDLEFDEWFDPKDDLEVIAIDEISEDDYNNFVDYMNDGMERG